MVLHQRFLKNVPKINPPIKDKDLVSLSFKAKDRARVRNTKQAQTITFMFLFSLNNFFYLKPKTIKFLFTYIWSNCCGNLALHLKPKQRNN